ncbi:MAG: phospholipase [Tannerella sp.]|jgi:hypothetical protein|nr:phospholipase [Tannerella sp.]
MWYLVSGIVILGVIVAIIGYFGNRKPSLTKTDERATNGKDANPATVSGECCGQHEICERDNLLAAAGKEIEYYDDEELDAYRGRKSDRYDEKEAEEFRETLYTMREAEVAGWLRSLQLRGIDLPDQLKDEALLIIEEQRKRN